MGKRKSAKAGGSGAGLLRKEKASVAAASKQQQDRDAMEQDSSDSEESGFVAFQSRDKHGSDDEDNEQEVFNLAVGDEEESVRFLSANITLSTLFYCGQTSFNMLVSPWGMK